ncbi:hypothetical protein JCM18750_02360 [Halostagnicola bangensis]
MPLASHKRSTLSDATVEERGDIRTQFGESVLPLEVIGAVFEQSFARFLAGYGDDLL